MSVNKVVLLGHLGADPETRYTQAGSAVVNIRLATSEKWTSKDGQPQERTEWHRVVMFGRLAENCRDYLSKGSQVYLEGKIQTRQWEDRDGNKRYTTEVVAKEVQFLSKSSGKRPESQEQSQPLPDYDPSNPPITDDDVPF